MRQSIRNCGIWNERSAASIKASPAAAPTFTAHLHCILWVKQSALLKGLRAYRAALRVSSAFRALRQLAYLNERVVLADLHPSDAAVDVKEALNVSLPHPLHIKVDHKQRVAGARLDLAVALGLLCNRKRATERRGDTFMSVVTSSTDCVARARNPLCGRPLLAAVFTI